MNRDPYANVACPKCKGGCSLCGGTGRVLNGVASAYEREEFRSTVKVEVPKTALKDAMRTSGVPAVIVRANRLRRATWGIIMAAVFVATTALALATRGCL